MTTDRTDPPAPLGHDPFDPPTATDRWETQKFRADASDPVFPAEEQAEPPVTAVPEGLAPGGLALWQAVVGRYELRPDELVLLEQLARAVDRLADVREALADAPLTVLGSTGQPRAHPLLGEERAGQLVLARLQAQLSIPDEDGPALATPQARAAAKAANVRWMREEQTYARPQS